MITGNEGDLFEAEDRFGWRVSGDNPQLSKLRTVAGSKARRAEKRRTLGGICSTKFAGSYAKKALALAISAGVVYCAEPSTKARTVLVHSQDVVPISVSVGFSTLVVLPKGEEIIASSCGDTKIWAIDWNGNNAFLKQGIDTPGERTNVNLVTASGNTYSFLVSEVSKDKSAAIDLRVILEQGDTKAATNLEHPAYVRAELANELKESLKRKEEEIAQIKKNASLDAIREQKHDYQWERGKEADAFGIRSIWHDNKFTYIEAESQNAPSLYEVIDGKDSVVQYSLENGKYVVTHIMSHGIFRAGKTKLEFKKG
jgi:type IV secretory pathway VirB9-like protein